MPNASQNLESKEAMWQALSSAVLIIFAVCLPLLSIGCLNQPAYGAGPIQPPSCEHPSPPPPQIPYPPGLTEVPINAPSFPPPGSESGPIGPGGPVQPPSCEHPTPPKCPLPYPHGLTQVPINAPRFPCPPVKPYCPIQYGCIPFHQIPTVIVPGPGNFPGVGIPGDVQYGYPGTTTLRTPLVPGASWSSPGYPAALGDPPPPGSGLTPDPVTPGMLGESPTLVPWADGTAGNPETHITNTLVIPSTQIDQPETAISMPFTNAAAMPPGTWNSPQVRDIIPKTPFTPGKDPGMLRGPINAGPWASPNGYNHAAAIVPLPDSGQLPVGIAPTSRLWQRGSTNDFGLSQKTLKADKTTLNPKVSFAYRMQMSRNDPNEPAVFNGWQGLAGSTTQDFGVGVKQLQAAGQLGSALPPQTSFDSPRPAQYPGGQNSTGNLSSTSPGNHQHNAAPPFFASAQVTNDLYGTPMINLSRKYTDGSGNTVSGTPLTTIAPY